MIYVYIAIPIISACIGWITNKIAIVNLFRPRGPINFLLFNAQGVIPRKRKEFTEKVAQVVDHYLVDSKKINSIASDVVTDKVRSEINEFIESCTKTYMSQYKILEPFSYRISSDIKSFMNSKIKAVTDRLVSGLAEEARKNLDVTEMVKENLDKIDIETIEIVITSVAHSELKHIEYMGAVIGFVVGVAQVILLLLLQ